ncbi:YTH domain-containing family protein 1 [Spatholobus suberectus]|nr:YTH domain-containing family protein 1 [Spatholobus suberectus]
MATVANPADQATDLLQKLSLETQPKALEIPEPNKKATGNQYGSVDSGNAANGQIPSYDRSVTPVLQDLLILRCVTSQMVTRLLPIIMVVMMGLVTSGMIILDM